MASELGAWQDRLALHFAALRDERQAANAELPVFGLEHGLDPLEVQQLESAIRHHIGSLRPSRSHELPWIAYSSEIGYRFSGDEYWQTFERETPGWIERGSRYWIRECYRRFKREFGGAEPSGAWAEHFSIICWPITHAVLPKDLQRQLARTLYELRYHFSKESLESPAKLGDLIASHSWARSSRFQNFAQEQELVGQFAMALLLHEEADSAKLLHSATLTRISQDLEQERIARRWLGRARQSAKELRRVRGLAVSISQAASPSTTSLESARQQLAALGIEPRLVLRPTAAETASWGVWLEIPDLSGLLHRFPAQRSVLTGSRCTVAGSQGRPLARGRCLHGPQQVRLRHWPRDDDVLLQFEQSHDQLEFLLRTECLLRPGRKWLFRIASDGLAYECRTLRVRPGERYILVSTDGSATAGFDSSALDLECDGIDGRILDLPSALNEEWQDELLRLGLQRTSKIEVWPVGLGAVAWDGEGHGEWLASDRPCLAILADHPLASIMLSVTNDPTSCLEIESIEPGRPCFVEVPRLPIGVHRIRASAKQDVLGEVEELGDLELTIRIQAPRQSALGTGPHSAFRVQIDPELPSLEDFWEGQSEVSISGPAEHSVMCQLELFDRNGDTPSFKKEMKAFRMPVSADRWRASFSNQLRENSRAQEAYDTARFCRLHFDAGETGKFTAQFEREFSPLRWALKGSKSERTLRLIDDSGKSNVPEVSLLTFDAPCEEKPLPTEPDYAIPHSGGMYVARQEGSSAARIVLPHRFSGLESLRCSPAIRPQARSAEAVVRVVNAATTWGGARLPGDPLSRSRQQTVLKALVQEIFRLIGGTHWGTEERGLSTRDRKQLESLSRAVSRHFSEQRVGADLLSNAERLSKEIPQVRIKYLASLATRYCRLPRTPQSSAGHQSPFQSQNVARSPEWLCELALRLASAPQSVESWAGESLPRGLERLLELPTIARAARFLVIAIDAYQRASGAGDLDHGWRWE